MSEIVTAGIRLLLDVGEIHFIIQVYILEIKKESCLTWLVEVTAVTSKDFQFLLFKSHQLPKVGNTII